MSRSPGFSILELVIACAMLALLATIALPSFADAMRRSRRTEGVTALQQLGFAQERWRSEHTAYAADLGALGMPTATASGRYTLLIVDARADGFTAQARAANDQAADRVCAVLQLTRAGGQPAYGSFDAKGTPATGLPNRCWGT